MEEQFDEQEYKRLTIANELARTPWKQAIAAFSKQSEWPLLMEYFEQKILEIEYQIDCLIVQPNSQDVVHKTMALNGARKNCRDTLENFKQVQKLLSE